MTLTKADIAQRVCTELGIPHSEAYQLVDQFFEEAKEFLASGTNLKLSGFGNFILRDKNARPGRNPKTGVESIIASRRVVTFKSGAKLKAGLQGLTPEELHKDGNA